MEGVGAQQGDGDQGQRQEDDTVAELAERGGGGQEAEVPVAQESDRVAGRGGIGGYPRSTANS